MLKLLAKKYFQEFVVVSDLKETKSYGVRYVGGKVASTSDPTRSADAYVDDWGGMADNFSALGFKDQAEQGMRSVCAKAVGVVSCTVELHVQPSTDRWDRLSFVDVMNASGTEDQVSATLAEGLSKEAYADQGWDLLNTLYGPDLPFTLSVFSGKHFLFLESWVVGQPRSTTRQMLLDYIRMNR